MLPSFEIAAPHISLPLLAALIGVISTVPAMALAKSYDARVHSIWYAPLAAAIAAATISTLGNGPLGVGIAGGGLILLCASVIDWQTMRLPNILSLMLALLGLSLALGDWRLDLINALTGALIGPLVLFVVDLVYRLFRRKSGVGMGDLKLMIGIGALVGPQAVLMVLIGASLTQAVVSILLLFGGPTRLRDALPFGPALALTGWVIMVFGHIG